MSEEQTTPSAPAPATMAGTLHERIHAAALRIGYIQKDATVTGGGTYKAVSHDQVTAHTRKPLLESGVLVMPSVLEDRVIDTGRKTASGTPIIRYEGKFRVRFIGVGIREEDFVDVPAHAEDHGDKAPGKAYSYATKNAILKVLQLETGESDESRTAEEEAPEPLSELELDGLKRKVDAAPDLKALRKVMTECFAVAKERADLNAHAAIKAYGAERSDKLPESASA